MKKTVCLISSLWVVVTLLSITSCHSNDLYDMNQYEKYLDLNSPVDSIDIRHQWVLSAQHLYRITANTGKNIKVAMILSDNPLANSTVSVLNQTTISDGGTVSLPVTTPVTQTILYAALVDQDGKYYVTQFPVTQTDVDFKSSSFGFPSGLTLKPQTYTFVFEENYPLAGDYDYNDLVVRMGIDKHPDNPKQITLDVTLQAVGCTNQIAGLVRLLNCTYNDIESVTTADGKTFDDNLPNGSKELLNNTTTFRSGQKGTEAVITLFNDAHWAMNSSQEVTENSGTIYKRKYYNTSISSTEDFENRPYATQKYIITFKDAEKAKNFTLEQLDPFIVAFYNSGRYETHLDNYKAAQVIYPYQVEYRIDKTLPWALMIPVEKFCYPLEGIQIGFRKKTQTGVYAMFGAYVTRRHSFGEWVEDCESNLDWYNYPTDENDVWIF